MPRFQSWKLVAAALLVSAATLPAQGRDTGMMDPAAHPRFDVATVKPADPAQRDSGFSLHGRMVMVRNEPMREIVAVAYGLHTQQVVNLPDWTDSRFDIVGSADIPGAPSWPQYQQMLRFLLEDRLGLKMHHATRDMTRFTVEVARGGIKFSPTKYTGLDLPDQTGHGTAGTQEWRITNNTMDNFSQFLQGFLDHPVVNQTGLTGKFDFGLKWARQDAANGADTNNLPGLLTALQEQLGLKVEAGKGPTDVLVIDHIDKPSDN